MYDCLLDGQHDKIIRASAMKMMLDNSPRPIGWLLRTLVFPRIPKKGYKCLAIFNAEYKRLYPAKYLAVSKTEKRSKEQALRIGTLHRGIQRGDTMYILRALRFMAKTHNWDEIKVQSKPPVIIFHRETKDGDIQKINVYYTTMTVQTAMNHPKLGPTQLNRKDIKPGEMEDIFKNPRVHTNKGYYRT